MGQKRFARGECVVAGLRGGGRKREQHRSNCCFKFHAKGKENNFKAFCSWNNQFGNIWRKGINGTGPIISHFTKTAVL